MYTKILVPLDGSEFSQQVIPYVQLMAERLGCPVELFRVIDSVSPALADPVHGRYLDRVAEGFDNEALDELKAVKDSLEHKGINVSTVIHEGRAASTITREAASDPGALIAMSTHGRSGVSRWFLGSVTSEVLHAASNPMFIVRSTANGESVEPPTLKNIILPLDGSKLGEQVLPHAKQLSKALRLNAHLVRVTPPDGEYHSYLPAYALDGATTVYHGPIEEFSKAVDAEAMEYLHRVGDRLHCEGIHSSEEQLLHVNPAAAIVDLAHEIPESIVAMTTHGRSGIGRWVLGSFADKVARHSGRPVLLVRAVEDQPES